MKKIFTPIILLFFVAFNNLYSQTINSTTNGNFLNPLTWDCMCIPSVSSNINVKHNVTLNTDWQINGGSITVSAGGSLISDATGRSILLSAGEITVNDMMDFKWLSIMSGTLIVNDTLKIKSFYNEGIIANYNVIMQLDSFLNNNMMLNYGHIETHTFYNADSLLNTGTYGVIDSAYNAGVFEYMNPAALEIDRFTNAGLFETSGSETTKFYDFTNTGTFSCGISDVGNNLYNTGTLAILDSLTVGFDILNTGNLYIMGAPAKFTVGHNFANIDSTQHTCMFYMDHCDATIMGDFYNRDTVYGEMPNNTLQVYGNSWNDGVFMNEFDFCDLTPMQPDGSPDLNTGTIDASVTFCTMTSLTGTNQTAFNVYPSPANDQLSISGVQKADYSIINALGQTVQQGKIEQTISTKNLAEGTYIIRFTNPKNNKTSFERFSIIH